MMQLSGRIACCAMSICFLTLTAGISAEVKLSTLLGDHMVLQRGKPVHVWGMADPAEKVTATFRGNATTQKQTPLDGGAFICRSATRAVLLL